MNVYHNFMVEGDLRIAEPPSPLSQYAPSLDLAFLLLVLPRPPNLGPIFHEVY